jgi:hypothetical protein
LQGCHIVGYFSKEKESSEDYNVACILGQQANPENTYENNFSSSRYSGSVSVTFGLLGA